MNKSKRYNKTRKIKRNKSRTKKRGGMGKMFSSVFTKTPLETLTIEYERVRDRAPFSYMFSLGERNLNKLQEKFENTIILKKKGLPDRILVNGKISSDGFIIKFSTEKNTEEINFLDYDRIVISFPKRLGIDAKSIEDDIHYRGRNFLNNNEKKNTP
jgi:hypothetical protein